jgi:ubiquinone/menaquinone biosynthesis C-methylase UbiE
MSVAAAFDRVAESYDRVWTESPAGRAQRDLIWRACDPLFHAGDRILDVGCGTGVDAAHYSSRGVTVEAVDASPAMIQIAQARGGFVARVQRAEELGPLQGPYDGALSNFGALNCVADLSGVSAGLARLIRPGGVVAVCTLGRFCAWEFLYYSVRGKFAKALRRIRGRAESSLNVAVSYPNIAQLRAEFAPAFKVRCWRGVGLAVPPSFVSLPAWLVRLLAACDRTLAQLPLLRALADHRLVLFVRM